MNNTHKNSILFVLFLSAFTSFSQEDTPVPPNDLNWVSSIRYDLEGTTISKNVNYFNSLGKSTQSQSWDITTKKIWNSETRYDYQGRPALQTLSAPIGYSFHYKPNFIQKSNGFPYTIADFESNPLSPTAIGTAQNSLGAYYSASNSTEPYQDITSFPFSRTIYSRLNPGAIKAVVGGNKTDTNNDGLIGYFDTWLQTYSFSMPAPSQGVGASKTVSRDVHGIEVVVFTDAEGNTSKAARSGDEEGTKPKSTVNSLITDLGFVDVHIPVGCSGVIVYNNTAGHQLKMYNLITEKRVYTSYNTLPSGFYRFSVETTVGPPYEYDASNPIKISHQNNYYDFTTNTYDKAGRLLRSTQPNGTDLVSEFKYNSLGQLLETTSPDEGTAQFKYRKDGQIRFSQNSKQAEANEYSYTKNDSLGRPVESGVLAGDFSTANPEAADLPAGSRKEQHFTQYDIHDLGLEAILGNAGTYFRKQNFVAGNVSKTWTKNPDTNTTWYSYDVYGRVEWIIQDIEGLGVKTIDYEYDFARGQVTKVAYQKSKPDESFTHRYSYNPAGQLTKVETSTDNDNYTLQATYEYYETGALKRTELADGIQGTDYVYNLNGQLKSINHPALSAAKDPGQDANDLFGMHIDYHTFDYARTQRSNITSAAIGTNQFNGNIKNTRWNTSGSLPTPREHIYSYEYNKNNWLSDAKFSAIDYIPSVEVDITSIAVTNPGQSLHLRASNSIRLLPGFRAKTGSDFTAKIKDEGIIIPKGDYNVSNITYDANGNIQTLNRNKNTENGSNKMDQLSYNYKTDKPNQLKRVDDAVLIATNANDIKDQTTENNYIYNSIGQLIENKDEQLKYEYNASGLVTEVQKNGTPLVRFFYDDRGQRIRKETLIYTDVLTTYYVRDAAGSVMGIYTGGVRGNQLSLKEHPIYGLSRLGVHYRQTNTDVYQLTDHLGNVRAVIMKNGENAVSLTSKTDYYPFGMPMPNRNIEGNYRYKFQGQEKDSETGKETFELRLWDGRIGRWLTVDPAGEFFSPYLGMGNNPISNIDPDGGCVDCDQNAANGSTYTDASGASWTKGADGWGIDSQFSDRGATVTASLSNIKYNKDINALAVVLNKIETLNTGKTAAIRAMEQPSFDQSISTLSTPFQSTNLSGGAMDLISGKVGLKFISRLARLKSISLPALKKVTINMGHIMSGHIKGGARASSAKTLFNSNLTTNQIQNMVKTAYSNSKILKTQGDRVKLIGEATNGTVIEMWLNKATKTIETAYPKF